MLQQVVYGVDAGVGDVLIHGELGREGVKFAIREMVQTRMVCMNFAH